MSEIKTLRKYADFEEALIARSFLASQGIEVLLLNEHHSSVNPNVRLALGGFELLAHDDDYQTAEELLNDAETGKRRDLIEVESCHECGGTEFDRRRNLLWVAVGFVYGVAYAPYAGRKWCANCGAAIGAKRDLTIVALLLIFGAALMWWAHS